MNCGVSFEIVEAKLEIWSKHIKNIKGYGKWLLKGRSDVGGWYDKRARGIYFKGKLKILSGFIPRIEWIAMNFHWT